jgi:16S rRNA processing protein RimM
LTGADAEARAAGGIVVLGRIVEACGLRGELRVHPFADDPAAWGAMSHWRLGRESDPPQDWQCRRLLRCRERSGKLIAALEGVADRDAAEALRGLLVGARREELPATRSGEYYWSDLVGLDVVNARGEPLGRVAGLIETGANDVLRVVDEAGGERLLPFVEAVIREVDAPGGRIVADWEADW